MSTLRPAVAQAAPSNAWATWSGFLAMAIALVGLVGIFSTYATAIPYERGLREEAALDRALKTDDRAGLEALRPSLADEADIVISNDHALPDRVASARAELLHHVDAAAAALGERMRLFIATFTILAIALGALLLRMVAKTPS